MPDKSPQENSKKPEVTVFSTPTCPWCVRAKQYLQQHQVPFKDVDVSEDYESALQMVQKSGQLGVPQLWVGEEVVVGFDQRRLNQLLKISNHVILP